MTRLFFLIFSIVGATGAGIGVVVALVLGFDDASGVIISAAAGTVLGMVASWVIARQLLTA